MNRTGLFPVCCPESGWTLEAVLTSLDIRRSLDHAQVHHRLLDTMIWIPPITVPMETIPLSHLSFLSIPLHTAELLQCFVAKHLKL